MPLIRRLHRSQRGFTTITLMGVLLVGGLLVGASFAAVNPEISLSREDQDRKQAYGAAEAGLQWYLSRLGQDNNFYIHCTNVDPPSPTEAAPVNQKWGGSGTDPRVWRNLPGEKAQYSVELMPVAGFAQCVEGNQYSMIDSSGNMRLRISGKSRGEVRTVLATLRRQNFLDFIYFTDYETLDPAAYSSASAVTAATKNCSKYRTARPPGACEEIIFPTVDAVRGPLHTNDSTLLCGKPVFGRNSRDSIEIVGKPRFNSSTASGCPGTSTPDIKGTLLDEPTSLGMPPSNSELSNIATATYKFTGKTTIELQGDQMTVWNTARFGSLSGTLPLPPNGVIYAGSSSCVVGFTRSQPYTATNSGCGDIWVKGNYTEDLTIAAANDVVINGNLVRGTGADGALLGLVGNNFVRVYHPVDSNPKGDDDVVNGCRNKPDALVGLTIHAAILALQHSFIVDNWFCGKPMSELNVHGAIAQKFRGPVGTTSSGSVITGYKKNYEYNDRLRYREPPYFLDPVQASWRISRETEQQRAVMQR